jgi:hypothetical protein
LFFFFVIFQKTRLLDQKPSKIHLHFTEDFVGKIIPQVKYSNSKSKTGLKTISIQIQLAIGFMSNIAFEVFQSIFHQITRKTFQTQTFGLITLRFHIHFSIF